MAEFHYFQPRIAEKYGINAAILLENFYFWIEKNRANGKHFHDGAYWTYNSVKAFRELFPYMSVKAIRTAIQKLFDEGILVAGNYNQSSYDRTMWYAITEKGYSILQNGNFHFPKTANGNAQNGKPIPDNKPYIDTDNKPLWSTPHTRQFTPPSIQDVRNYCSERGNGIDAEQFVDFYASKGWKVGNASMKDWKAAVRTWEKRDRSQQKKGGWDFSDFTGNG